MRVVLLRKVIIMFRLLLMLHLTDLTNPSYVVYFTFSAYSGLLINIILICGAVLISRPSATIPKSPVLRLVTALLGLYTVLQILVAWVPGKEGNKPRWLAESLGIHYNNSMEVVVWVTYTISFLPGPFAVVVAVQHLFTPPRNAQATAVSQSECIKIIMLCIPNFVYPIFLMVDFTKYNNQTDGYAPDAGGPNIMPFMGKTFIPIFSSTWNPVFVALLTHDMRQMIRDMLCKKTSKRENTIEHGSRRTAMM